MTTPAGDGKTPHSARNLFDGIDLASNTMKVCLGSNSEVRSFPNLGPLCGVERTLKLRMSAYRLKAVVSTPGAELPFLAISSLLEKTNGTPAFRLLLPYFGTLR